METRKPTFLTLIACRDEGLAPDQYLALCQFKEREPSQGKEENPELFNPLHQNSYLFIQNNDVQVSLTLHCTRFYRPTGNSFVHTKLKCLTKLGFQEILPAYQTSSSLMMTGPGYAFNVDNVLDHGIGFPAETFQSDFPCP